MDNTVFADRLRGLIWGQLTADAAALGAHWIYDLAELAQRYPQGVHGFEIPAPGHYHERRRPGEQTHYGEQLLLQLEGVATQGLLDVQDYGRRIVRHFGAATYDGYLDRTVKTTLANARDHVDDPEFAWQAGETEEGNAYPAKLGPVLARYAAAPEAELLAEVERATRVTNNSGRTVAYALADALLTRALLNGAAPADAVQSTIDKLDAAQPLQVEVQEKLKAVLDARDQEHVAVVKQFGQACPVTAVFPGAVHALLRYPHDYQAAVTATLRAGGDNASRAILLGGWIGAANGVDAVPTEWREKLAAYSEIGGWADKIALGVGGSDI